jgi:hypothetical protein
MMPHCLLITGPPAVGKSTVRRALVQVANARFAGALNLGVDDVLRDLFTNGTLTTADAYVDPDGALILAEPAVSVPLGMGRVLAEWMARPVGAIIEVPVDNSFLAAVAEDRRLAAQTAVILLAAPLEIRLRRNAARSRSRISETGLCSMQDGADPVILGCLRKRAALVCEIDASCGLQTTIEQCTKVLRRTSLFRTAN